MGKKMLQNIYSKETLTESWRSLSYWKCTLNSGDPMELTTFPSAQTAASFLSISPFIAWLSTWAFITSHPRSPFSNPYLQLSSKSYHFNHQFSPFQFKQFQSKLFLSRPTSSLKEMTAKIFVNVSSLYWEKVNLIKRFSCGAQIHSNLTGFQFEQSDRSALQIPHNGGGCVHFAL